MAREGLISAVMNATTLANVADRKPRECLTAAESERNRLIELYLPFVKTVLTKVQRNLPTHVNADDLYSAGVTGLISAVERYDPSKANTFSGYVCLRIRGSILDELRRFDSSSRRCRARNKQLEAAVMEVERDVHRAATEEEVSAHLKISVVELARRREMAKPIRIVSLDHDPERTMPGRSPLHEVIADENQECVRETLEKAELIELLASRLAELPSMQKKILALYYFEGLRFNEIAKVFDLTESRISQIHKLALGKLGALVQKAKEA